MFQSLKPQSGSDIPYDNIELYVVAKRLFVYSIGCHVKMILLPPGGKKPYDPPTYDPQKGWSVLCPKHMIIAYSLRHTPNQPKCVKLRNRLFVFLHEIEQCIHDVI